MVTDLVADSGRVVPARSRALAGSAGAPWLSRRHGGALHVPTPLRLHKGEDKTRASG